MTGRGLLLSCVMLAACAGPRTAGTTPVATGPAPEIRSAVAEIIRAQAPPRVVAVAWRDLTTGSTVAIDGDLEMHAASLMKVAVMIEVFRQAERGEIGLDDPVEITLTFRSIVDGSPFTLSGADDGDPDIYDLAGTTLSVRELTRRMIDRSSNVATNLLLERVGPRNAEAAARALGATRTRVLRGVEDARAFRAGLINTTTATDMTTLMSAIATHRAASPDACEEMLHFLFAQRFNEMIPAGIPPSARVAHKTGQITAIHHDAAIIYPEGRPPFALTVMTKGFEDETASAAVAARIAGAAYAISAPGSAIGARPVR